MVEGPTAKAYAIKISREFSGETITNIFVKSKKVLIPTERLVGEKFLRADSLGKNILLFFDDAAIRIHLMMFGAIHLYGLDEPLLKPVGRVRLMLIGNHKKLVVYNAPIIEVGIRNEILERLKSQLGPDPLSDEWNEETAVQNVMKFPGEKIGVVLLNQSVIAGIGNILRNEVLFRVKINPERTVDSLSIQEVRRIVQLAKGLSEKFLELKLQGKGIGELLQVYNVFGGLCKICGHPIKFYMQKPINRKTFVCTKLPKMIPCVKEASTNQQIYKQSPHSSQKTSWKSKSFHNYTSSC